MAATQRAAHERSRETDLGHANGLGRWLANWIAQEADVEMTFDENDPRGVVVTIRSAAAHRPHRSEPMTA